MLEFKTDFRHRRQSEEDANTAPGACQERNANEIVESDDMLRELIGDWESYLREDDQQGFLDSVRREAFVNRPLGDETFVSDLEKRFQLRLTRGKVGRPKIEKK
jgi:hypothetical protein